ncbi:TPA: Ig-like domain-containing protein [Escherichia coli]|uniref:Ig-like domain-containing protein n=4 Tax=Escherichia coli TaxID=562 RepID=A0AAW7UP57_ECOLX|nr:Ig-like domain-containing protein [Escherichia coli]MCC5020893.1 Ig-like domain-containing protein [Escherichia coli]MCE7709815.1 Ig-like domain-containing protein [Escherichia coli]MCI3398848.1 Ig-like domain-containing protein [Escherichia coli]MCK2402445.1 Ig-like domain-containing protein [Escherichia coli]MCK2466096.1 Ig-like domain-containing protein [Escherichia coli]
MATKKRSGEEINDRQILCGMGIKLRRLTAGICLVTQLVFPMTVAAQGVVNAATQQPVPTQIAIANANTVPYTLGALESAQSVAERFGISLAELRKLNQFRTFARGFDNVRQGDELDVPAQVSEKNLTPPPGNSSDNLEQQIASTSQQIGSLLAEDMNSEQAANMARGWASSQASGAMTDWLSRFGTARITLGVDEDFSLKNSQFDFLHPWYETPDNLFFSQHTLHRTDERTQINNGLGWRHFTPTWMSGINFFFDHDLSRYHSRAGIGAEYWRDYLKLSSNGYLRLTNWRSAPELDNDYEARPANGWDVRAEGWLPAWPHLGGKLVYEQYYGDEVALFDKDDRQSNPHAITAGLNYTPFPLMTFSAEQRQGKQGENDTRFAVDFTWQPGSAMQKQLDPNEVAARRSLAGSRYDLVDRNNNIVLEYRKKELVRLTLTDPVTGKSGEVKSLVSSLQTKYALKGYNVEATALEAAGGKVVTTGKDILVTLPPYRFTSTPETDNTWPIEVTAEDVKGNFSNREQSMVVVQAPTLSQKDSSVSLSTQTLSADSHSTATLTFIAHDAAGNPVIGLVLSTRHEGVQDITLSDWKDNGDGSYTQVLTTGAMSGTLTLMPQLNGVDAAKAPAVVNIISVSSSRTHSSIKIDKDRYLSGNPIEVTVELRDENDKPVKEQKQQLNTAVSIDNVKPGVTTDWKETADGVYKATYTAYTKGSGLTAKLLMQNWNEDLHTAGFIIDANPQSAKIATLSASNNGVLANENAANTVSVNVADEGSNPINDHTVTFAVLNGSATSFNNQNTAKTDVNGLATFDLKSSKQEDNTVEVTLENGVKQTLIVSFVGDSSTAQVDLQKSKNEVVADGNDSATMTATVRDAKGNLLNDVKVTFNVNSAAAKLSQTEVNSHDGIATATLTSLKNGDYRVTASVSSGSQANQQVNFIGDQSTAALTLSVPSGDITVTNTAPQHMTATLQDKNGNPLKDKEITFTVPNDVASRFSISNGGKGMTDSNGVAIASLTGTLAGTHMITARLANSNVSDTQPMTFVADKDSAVVVLQTSKAEIIGNGVDETTLTATVKDPFDNVVKNLSVVFRTSPADTQLSLNTRNTNENGIAEVTLKGTVLGVHTAEAILLNGNRDTKTVNIAPDASNAQVTLNIPAQQVVTNNSDSVQLTATVKDPSNHPVAGITVNFTMPQDVAANFTLENNGIAITQANGEAHVTLKGKKAGTHTVTATLGNNNASDAQPVTFVADKDSAVVVLQTSKAEIIGNGVDETTLTATVKDPFDNVVKDLPVTFSTNPADTQLSQSTSNTNDSGVAEVTLKGTVLGVHTAEATLPNGNNDTKTVNIAPDTSNAQVTLNIPAQQVVTNNSDSVQLTATVKDPSNHPVAGITVNFTMPQDVAANFTLENNGIAITQANGEAHVTLKGKKAGTHTVTATLGNNNASDAQPVTFVADKDNAIVVLQTSKAEIIGNGVDETTLTATVKDPFDNVVKDLPVTFSTDPADTQLSQSTSNTNDSGVAEVTLKGTVLGVHTAEATLPNGNNDTKTVNIAPDASNAQVTLNIPAQQVVTNNSDSVQLTATVKDPSNHPVAGITVNFTMPQDVAANFTLENNGIAITQANGEAHVTLKGKKAGTHTVTATLGNNNTSDSQPVTFVADKTSAQVVLQMSKDEITGNGVDNATLTATVKDQFDNEVNNLPVTFSSASSGLTLTPGVSNTNESGIAQASLAGVAFGEQTVTASLANNGASDNKTVHFIGDTAAAKIIELTAVPDRIIAGTPQNSSGSVITATIVDNNGFPVKGVTVSFTSRTKSAEMTNGGQAVTNEQGKATVTYTNTRSSRETGARPDTIEASLENGSSTLSTSIQVDADASTAHLTSLYTLYDTQLAGEDTALYITVNDNYGNGVPLHQVTLSVSPSEGVTLSNNGINTTNHDGYLYASMTATKAGVYQVTATLDNGDSMQHTVTYVPNVANAEITLAASKDPVIADNNDLTTLTATVADTEGNAIANTEVTFTLPEDVRANFTLSDGGKAITDTEGKAKVTLKGTKAGAHTVTASMAGGKSGQLVVNFTADTLTAQVNLNVTEDNFIANNVGMTTLQATVTDGNGNPLANEAVTFTLPADVSASFTLGQGGSAITDINGKAEVTLSGTKSGTYPVTVSVNNYGVSDTKQVTLIADAGTAKLAGFTASSSSFTASTTEGATLTASVTDAYGNPLEGIMVNFRGSATLSNTSVETDAQGKAEVLVTSTIAGTKVITANLANAPTEAAMRTLTVKADIDSATITSLEMPEGQVIIREPIAVKAHVDDQFGNPVADQLVTFSAEPSSFNMVISQDTVSTNRQGIAEVTMTPGRYGSYTVKASLANGSSYEKDLVVIDLRLTLTASSQLIGVNDPSGATLTVRLTHANGAPLSHELVTFSVTPEGATLSNQTATTNTSGEAQVVLTSNKVGTYVVTASIHSGVIIQTQTTVKVTGNPSTAHVASFIADPSTLTANNSDISTLKATVEDSSGNLVEGVNVNFALKRGFAFATLTSLTAVTDQNGVATTSVRGAITGSVTVSAETSYGGAQTVDITLVAGPADASQSVLKNNRSSLKGDFTESAELYLVLHDLSGHPINVSEGLEFVQSGTNVPYVQISTIDYTQNLYGEYKATVTGGGEGIATLIPVLNGVHQAGLSTTIEFISAGTRPMTGTVSVNGANLPAASFPSQGFTGAYYQLNNDNFAPGKTAADYAFSSSASWVGVDATGKVTFKNDGDSNTVIITATPRSGGAIYQTQVRVKGWWKDNNNIILPLSRAENYCNNEIGNGYAIPGVNLLSSGENRREIGSLFGEWGDMGHYMDADFYSEIYWSSNTAGGGRQYIVSLENGAHGSVQTSEYFHVACYKNI